MTSHTVPTRSADPADSAEEPPTSVPVPFDQGRGTSSFLDPSRLPRQVAVVATSLRWAILAIGLILVAGTRGDTLGRSLIAAAVLTVNTGVRTIWPLPMTRRHRFVWWVTLDLCITVACIAVSGRWDSPFALMPVGTILVVGFVLGYLGGAVTAAGTALGIAVIDLVARTQEQSVRLGFQVGLIFVTAGVLGGLTKRMSIAASAGHAATVTQLERMAAANKLLLTLHGLAQTLPSSLDLGDVLASARNRLHELFDSSAIAVFIRDESSSGWRVELAEGVRLDPAYDTRQLPPEVAATVHTEFARAVTIPLSSAAVTCAPLTRSAMYAPLWARDSVVGIIAVEHKQADAYAPSDAAILTELAEPLALAVDNALWFARLRTLGAEAERSRIARDLHDRIAQSLAYVTFELERLAKDDPDSELYHLRDVVRDVVSELRETLYQLRANVSAENALEAVTREFLARYQDRTGIAVIFTSNAAGQRLPLPVEQELWRILQEALTNVERHAHARRVQVGLHLDNGRCTLEIRDDGRGFRQQDIRRDSFGIMGMRERAEAIGAHMTVDSEPACGVRILIELEVPR